MRGVQHKDRYYTRASKTTTYHEPKRLITIEFNNLSPVAVVVVNGTRNIQPGTSYTYQNSINDTIDNGIYKWAFKGVDADAALLVTTLEYNTNQQIDG
jgi:hypothetical protein